MRFVLFLVSVCSLPWFSKEFTLVVFAKSNKMLIFVCYIISTTFSLHLKQNTFGTRIHLKQKTSETKDNTLYKYIHDFTNDIVYNITYDITTYEHKKIKTNVSSLRLRSDGGKSCFCKRRR